jgi:two-component system NtrC family sensor kinase
VSASVLIVDDSLTVRMDLKEAFEAAGLVANLCATASEAREAIERETFAVLVLDVVLPDADGVDFLAEIRRGTRAAAIPIMLLSSEAEVRDRIRGLETGADEYIGKPYDAAYVVARAKELIRKQRVEPAADARTTVLVIDDSATFREELRGALEAVGYSVVTAGTGEEGLRVVADLRPGAVVVDGMLPGIDGATVVRRIRLDAALRGTPCLLLTASEERDAELRALDSGVDAFVRKDEDIGIIRARLAAILRGAAGPALDDAPRSLLGPKKVLAVDDSPTYLHAIAETLRAEGYDVVLANSGEEALALLSVQPVDCVLLDLMMPGIGGEETCRRVKNAPSVRDTPLIMLTALEDREAMIRGLGAGADDFIAKSSDLAVLKARVLAQIRRKQFEDENRHIREQLLRKEHEASEARASRALAEMRARLLEDLEHKNRELEAFSYSVSHDLRAPLRAIDGFSQVLLEDYCDKLDEGGQGHLRRIRAASQRMGHLIDAMLSLARITRADLQREPVDLAVVATAVAAQLRATQPEREVEFIIPKTLEVVGDPHLLRALLENLLGNAWKFTRARSPAIIELGVLGREDPPVYVVRDNGAGFDMAYASKLFAPFQRLHAASDFAGTGIGLATVKRIVDRHGGRVWAEGVVDRGATVHFTLSVAPRGNDAGLKEGSP